MALANKPTDTGKDITNVQADDIKQGLLFALESYTPAQKEAIITRLKEVYNGIYSKNHEKPFHTISAEDTQGLSDYLDALLPIFSGGEPHRNHVKKKLLAFIECGKKNATSEGGLPVDRILFFYNKDLHGIGMNPDFGDKINMENNIDIWDEDGNGGIQDYIDFPGAFDDPHSGKFAMVNATEDLIKKRPNAILIVIKARPRRKFDFLMHQYFHPGVAKYYPEVIEAVWNATDEEVRKKFAREVEEDR